MPLFREKKPIEIDNQTLFESLKQRTNPKPKKSVRFTWSGLSNLIRGFSPDLGYKVKRIQELSEGTAKPVEKDYIDFFEDMEKSIFGAAQNIAYSFGDLITTGIDMAADTDLTQKLDKVYEETKIDDPETLLGSVNKVLIEYGLPGGAVFKIMNRAKKLIWAKKIIVQKKIIPKLTIGFPFVGLSSFKGIIGTLLIY